MTVDTTSSTAVPAVEDILPRLQALLQTCLGLESTAALRPETRFQEDLQADSLAMVDVVIGVEEEFGIRLQSDFNFLSEVRTIGDAVELIRRRMAGGAAAP